MTHPSKRLIVVVLDRSGSMVSTKADAEGGFNTFIADQRKEPFKTQVTLTQFDTLFETVYSLKDIEAVPALRLEPRGGTALYDAVGKTINEVGTALAKLPENKRPAKVFFVIITDGGENSSREFTGHQVKEMIAHQQDKYGWQFVFLGSDITTMATAASIGIRGDQTLCFSANSMGTATAYNTLSSSISVSSTSGAPISYTEEDKKAVQAP